MPNIEFVQITWLRAFKVWWSLLWRGVVFGILAGGATGFILGIFMGLARVDSETIKSTCAVVAYIVSVPVGIMVTKFVLKNHYSDFRIALIKDKD
ncbi:MAG: hypothetical protein ABIC18_04405 [Candidatus Omnitrophota bacterium]